MPAAATTDCYRRVTLLCPDGSTMLVHVGPDGEQLSAAEFEALTLYAKDAPANCREDCSGECDDDAAAGGVLPGEPIEIEPQPLGPIQMCNEAGEKVGVAFVKFGEDGPETTYLGPDLAPLPEGTDTSGWKCCDPGAALQTFDTYFC